MKKAKSDVKSLRFATSGRWGLGVTLGAAAIVIAGTGTAGAVSLEDAVRSAVNTNPDIGVVAKDRLAVDQELRQGKALYYPSVDGAVTAGYDWTLEKAGALPGTAGRLWKQDNSIIISQTLFDGYAAASEVQRQSARVDSAALRVIATSESIGLDAVQGYTDVVREGELVALAQDNQKTHERYLGDMKARLRGGTGSMADVRQAESRLARAIATVTEEKGKLNDAETSYIKTVGEAPDGLSKPASVENLMPASVDMAVAMAIESSPPIAVANADIRTSQAELRASRADFFPKIKLQLGELWNRNDSAVKGQNREEQALVVMNWNVFRGGETVAKNEEFVQRLAESREVLGQAERKAENEARLSWNELQTARDRGTAVEVQVKANEKVRDAYTQQFNLGQRSLLDVLDAENELFISRGDLLSAQYQQLFAGYRMLAVEGQLLKTLGVTNRKEGMTMEMADKPAEPADQNAAAADSSQPADGAADGATPAASTDENAAPAADAQPAADTTPADAKPAAETKPAADAQPKAPASDKQATQAPTEGFKQASGQVSDDSVMTLNFNPVWSVQ
jgi:adhesin transport system outer membrane protein